MNGEKQFCYCAEGLPENSIIGMTACVVAYDLDNKPKIIAYCETMAIAGVCARELNEMEGYIKEDKNCEYEEKVNRLKAQIVALSAENARWYEAGMKLQAALDRISTLMVPKEQAAIDTKIVGGPISDYCVSCDEEAVVRQVTKMTEVLDCLLVCVKGVIVLLQQMDVGMDTVKVLQEVVQNVEQWRNIGEQTPIQYIRGRIG